MTYAKGALTVTASLSVALLGPGLLMAARGLSQEKATGLAATAGDFVGVLMSPLFWICAFLSFALFFLTSRLKNKILSVLLFWIPSIAFSTLACVSLAGFAYLLWYFNRG